MSIHSHQHINVKRFLNSAKKTFIVKMMLTKAVVNFLVKPGVNIKPKVMLLILEIKLVKTYVPVIAPSLSAAYASTALNVLATKIILTALFVAVKHIVNVSFFLILVYFKTKHKYLQEPETRKRKQKILCACAEYHDLREHKASVRHQMNLVLDNCPTMSTLE